MDGLQVVVIRSDVMKELLKYPEVFKIKDNENTKMVEFNPVFRDYKERTEHAERVLWQFQQDDVFIALKGWRDEVKNLLFHNIQFAMSNHTNFFTLYFISQCYDVKAGHNALLKLINRLVFAIIVWTCMFMSGILHWACAFGCSNDLIPKKNGLANWIIWWWSIG